MGIQKLVLDTIIDDDYELIALHSSVAPYRLGFLLNKYLDLNLFRKKEDVYFEYDSLLANFPLFQYNDHFQYNMYSLLGNKFTTKITTSKTGNEMDLFATEIEEVSVTKYLVPELKNVDYFLKIETDTTMHNINLLIAKLIGIPQIATAYSVDYSQLKSKNNLILE